MALLNKEVQEATKKKFDEELVNTATIVFFTQEPSRLVLPDFLKGQECMFCKETRELLEEVSALSDKIELQICDFLADKDKASEYGIDKIPAAAIIGAADPGIRFYGIPSGYEYLSLIEAIIDVSRGTTKLSQKIKDALKTLERDTLIQVFVTPTCPYCSLSVRLAHQFALESPRIRAEMVESTEFPQLANKYNVYGVPKTVINGTSFIEGALPDDAYLAEILKAVASPKP